MKSITIAGNVGKDAVTREGGSAMKFAPLPPVEMLRELISYDHTTGALTWNQRPRGYFKSDGDSQRWNNRYSGKPAFACPTKHGYLSGAIFKRLYQAHRICWTIYTGGEPSLILDHINGDRADNRIANLREATFMQNIGNRASVVGSSSAFRGVSWCTRDKRWIAYCAGRTVGRFTDELSAAKAYNQSAASHYGEFAKINVINGDVE